MAAFHSGSGTMAVGRQVPPLSVKEAGNHPGGGPGPSESCSSSAARVRFWREDPMKKLLILAAAGSLCAPMANAKTATVTTGAGNAAVQIEPQYRTKIKTYITENKIRPVESREKIVVGAKVPSDVDLVTVPSEW